MNRVKNRRILFFELNRLGKILPRSPTRRCAENTMVQKACSACRTTPTHFFFITHSSPPTKVCSLRCKRLGTCLFIHNRGQTGEIITVCQTNLLPKEELTCQRKSTLIR